MSQSKIAMTLKIEAGKKYRTRGGDKVEVLRTDLQSDRPVLGILTQCSILLNGDQYPVSYRANGRCYKEDDVGDDLISEIKPKRAVWMNVYPAGEACWHDSRVKAERGAGGSVNGRLACIRVEFEEGQFDE